MIGKILGIGGAAREVGEAVGSVAEVFVGNRAERDAGDLERFNRALAQFGEEFGGSGTGWFERFVNGLNRLPRPMMAVGTLGLFIYAMVDPQGFATRMQGLAFVPEPLWWLLGAIVSFYFGARELHHYRGRKLDLPVPVVRLQQNTPRPAPVPAENPAAPRETAASPTIVPSRITPAVREPAAPRPVADPADPTGNAAFEEWRALRA